jgi:hypothetical protein
MRPGTIVAWVIVIAAAMTTPTLSTKAQTGTGRVANQTQLVDPGFEFFKLAPAPSAGWSSDDVMNPNDPLNALVIMTPDSQTKVEGQYSLRIEQPRPRPENRGQAFLAQAVSLPKQGGNRSFDLAMQMRGSLDGPVTIHIYVWDGSMARVIGQVEAPVKTEWRQTALSFTVPNGYDRFGLWIYLPRDREALVWLDDVRLTAIKKH